MTEALTNCESTFAIIHGDFLLGRSGLDLIGKWKKSAEKDTH